MNVAIATRAQEEKKIARIVFSASVFFIYGHSILGFPHGQEYVALNLDIGQRATSLLGPDRLAIRLIDRSLAYRHKPIRMHRLSPRQAKCLIIHCLFRK